MFYDRFEKLCIQKNISPSKAALEIGFNKSNVSRWKADGYTPRGEVLDRIANYFGVSIDYLLTRKEKATTENDDGLTDEIISQYYRLDEKHQKIVQQLILSLLDK